jgi:predicted lipoprotein with Yx(FWY)xxD motif
MRPTNRSRIGFLTAIGGIALVLAACSSSGSSTAPSAAAPSAAAPTTAASAAAGGGGSLTLATASGPVGTFLTGADGKTLYIFTKDSPNKSVCEGDCAAKWPPVIVSGDVPAAPSGVSGALTTFARSDGSMQLAINGLPLYYYAPDTKAGDTTGQGVGGVWFVATPDGALPSASPSAGKY